MSKHTANYSNKWPLQSKSEMTPVMKGIKNRAKLARKGLSNSEMNEMRSVRRWNKSIREGLTKE